MASRASRSKRPIGPTSEVDRLLSPRLPRPLHRPRQWVAGPSPLHRPETAVPEPRPPACPADHRIWPHRAGSPDRASRTPGRSENRLYRRPVGRSSPRVAPGGGRPVSGARQGQQIDFRGFEFSVVQERGDRCDVVGSFGKYGRVVAECVGGCFAWIGDTPRFFQRLTRWQEFSLV